MNKFKKIFLSGLLTSLAFSATASYPTETLYITYQKTFASDTDWVISSISSDRPSPPRVGIEEVLLYTPNGLSPAYELPDVGMTNGYLTYDCKGSKKNRLKYSACYSYLSDKIKKLDLTDEIIGIPGTAEEELFTYNVPAINKIFTETRTQEKVDEFWQSEASFNDLLQYQESLWLSIMETLIIEWNEYDSSKAALKPVVTIKDKTGLFTEEDIKDIPNLITFNDTYQYPVRPHFMSPESLFKYDPKVEFHVHRNLDKINRIKKVLEGNAERFLQSEQVKLRTYTQNYHLKNNSNTINGWKVITKTPSTISRLSSNKRVPVEMVVLGRVIKNITPELELNDYTLKININNNGDIEFQNNSGLALTVDELTIESNLGSIDYKKPIKLKMDEKTGVNLFEQGLYPENNFSNLDRNTLLTTFLNISVTAKYTLDGEEFYLFEEASQNVMSSVRK